MRVRIRQAHPSDAEEVARVYVASWNEGFSDRMRKRRVDRELVRSWRETFSKPSPHRWWVASREAAVEGFVGIGPSRDPVDPTIGEVDTIAVDPLCWRSGIGRALMQHAVRQLTLDGYRSAVLWTLSDYPLGASFYRATGWWETEQVRAGGSEVCFSRRLETKMGIATPTELERPVRYSDRHTPVFLGDRIDYRSLWFRRKRGRITYVPGISPKHGELEFNGLTWVAIDFDDGTRTGVLVDPDSGCIKKSVQLVARDSEGFDPIQPSDPFDE